MDLLELSAYGVTYLVAVLILARAIGFSERGE